MTRVFADTGFWFALANKADNLHQVAKQLHEQHKASTIITTDECLVEFLCQMREPRHKKVALALLKIIRSTKQVIVKEQSRASFELGLAEYERYHDKSFSLVDCISFNIMRDENIHEALAHDDDFRQAGFSPLMRVQ
jgi:uncharacterized protein